MSNLLHHKDLAYDNMPNSMPSNVSDMIGEVRAALSSGWNSKHVPFLDAVRRVINTPVTVLAEAQKPKQTAGALNALRVSLVHFFDDEFPGWDSEVTVDFFRDTTAHVFFFPRPEHELLKEAERAYHEIVVDGRNNDMDGD